VELTALPQTPSWFLGAASRQEGNGGEGREGRGGVRAREEGGGMGKGGGIAPWLLGDRRPWIKRASSLQNVLLQHSPKVHMLGQ